MNPGNFIPKRSDSLVRQLAEFLTNRIIGGKLKSGERLIENELRRKFGISRGPIREAFRILEKNGLVVTIPHKGSYVRSITSEYISEVFPIRANLEGLAARLAVQHLEPQDIKEMKSILNRMIESAKKKDLRSFVKNHFEFHQVFIDSSKNYALIELLENLRHQCVWFLFSSSEFLQNYPYSIDDHRKILEYFVEKDSIRVETLVRDHMMIPSKILLPLWQQKRRGILKKYRINDQSKSFKCASLLLDSV